MTFTTQPPARPGYYLWKWCEGDPPSSAELTQEGVDALKSRQYGLWGPRMVPEEEVEKAFREGVNAVCKDVEWEWNRSNARKVVEAERDKLADENGKLKEEPNDNTKPTIETK